MIGRYEESLVNVRNQVTETISRIQEIGIVPVIVLDDPDLARPLGDALAEGGLPCAEVTLRTPRAADVLKLMAQDPRLVVGAGTVLTVDAGATT